MPSKKTYIITSITLGIIAAASAGLISVANLLTKEKIKQNEIEKINKGICEIFGNSQLKYDDKISSQVPLDRYKYVNTLYTVRDNNEAVVGYALRTSGSNMYGKISLIVGVDKTTFAFKKLSIITNEQTYATTLVDNYIEPLNDGRTGLDDVSCGATYGAKLVRDMVNEATQAASEINWGI